MNLPNNRKLWTGVAFAAVTVALGSAYAQQGPRGKSSYAPVEITEPFSAILARLSAQKPSVEREHMAVLNERYDLSNRPAAGVGDGCCRVDEGLLKATDEPGRTADPGWNMVIGPAPSSQADLDKAVEDGIIEIDSDAWKAYVADALAKQPAERTKTEKDTIGIAMDAKAIAAQVEQAARKAFGGGKLYELWRDVGRSSTTAAIKQIFHDLGIKLGFRTAWSGCKTDGEWLYDLVWFVEDEARIYTTRLPLILESEHQMSKEGTVNLDYVKLVAGRADVRVWLSWAAKDADAKARIRLCKKQARCFAGALPGDTYVFITPKWDWSWSAPLGPDRSRLVI